MTRQLPKFNPNMLYIFAEQKGMSSTEELADFLGIPAGTVQDWLDGRSVPNNIEASILLTAFNLAPEWFAVSPARMAAAA